MCFVRRLCLDHTCLSFALENGSRVSFMQCGHCGLVYLDPRPTLAQMQALYEQPYYTHRPLPDNLYQRLKKLVLVSVAVSYLGYAPMKNGDRLLPAWLTWPLRNKWLRIPAYVPEGRLLDVGCGNGAYLEMLSELGWECWGTEISEQAAAWARKRGLNVRVGVLEDLDYPNESFDVITLWHVIEHLPQPLQTLQRIFELLKPGGMVLLGTPNVASTWSKLFGRYWDGLHIPFHLQLFSPKTISQLLTAAGFKIQFVKSFTTPQGFASNLRAWLSGVTGISVHTINRYSHRFDLMWLPVTLLPDFLVRGENMVAWGQKPEE